MPSLFLYPVLCKIIVNIPANIDFWGSHSYPIEQCLNNIAMRDIMLEVEELYPSPMQHLGLYCACRMSMLNSGLKSRIFLLSGKDLARRGLVSSSCASRPSRMCRSTWCKPSVRESSCGGSFCSRLRSQHTLASSHQRSHSP